MGTYKLDKSGGGSLEDVLTPARAGATAPSSPVVQQGELRHVLLDELDDNPYQPRVSMDPTELEELASSLERDGLLQPIAIRPKADGRYIIVAGHRRRAAYRLLRDRAAEPEQRERWSAIPGFVQLALDDTRLAVDAYVENTRRAALNPIEEAEALVRIRDMSAAKTAKEVAQLTSQPEQRVVRLLRLAGAPAVIRDGVASGILVPVLNDQGQPETTSKGKEKRESRKLDMLAALEFARLHKHLLAKRAPKAADERVRSAIEQCLSENWGLRRITTYVDTAISGRKPEAAADQEKAAPASPARPWRVTADRITIDRRHLQGLDPAVLAELRQVLDEALAAAARPASGGPADAPGEASVSAD